MRLAEKLSEEVGDHPRGRLSLREAQRELRDGGTELDFNEVRALFRRVASSSGPDYRALVGTSGSSTSLFRSNLAGERERAGWGAVAA